jgi:uncharacterized protein (TIGR03067 family)
MDLQLTGRWQAIQAELAANPLPKVVTDMIQLNIEGDHYAVQNDSGMVRYLPEARLEIKGLQGPNQGKTMLAIYKVAINALTICYNLSGSEWPSGFETTPGSQLFLVQYKRLS